MLKLMTGKHICTINKHIHAIRWDGINCFIIYNIFKSKGL